MATLNGVSRLDLSLGSGRLSEEVQIVAVTKRPCVINVAAGDFRGVVVGSRRWMACKNFIKLFVDFPERSQALLDFGWVLSDEGGRRQ